MVLFMRYGGKTFTAWRTHSKCALRIAISLQQWSHELPTLLRYTYIACLVKHDLL